jgi:hypothetical protein
MDVDGSEKLFSDKLREDPGNVYKTVDTAFLENLNKVAKTKAKNVFNTVVNKPSSQAAQWRIRVRTQKNKVAELAKLGKCPLLLAGPLLTAYKKNTVEIPYRYSNRRQTLKESPIISFIRKETKMQQVSRKNWNDLEEALQSLGMMICLALVDLNSREILEAFNTLKVWCISNAFKDDCLHIDEVIAYIKWLSKQCQAYLLQTVPDEKPEFCPGPTENVNPFVGELSFLSIAIKRKVRRAHGLTVREAEQAAQLCQLSRALPYPSHKQTVCSVAQTVDTFQQKREVSKRTLAHYSIGLKNLKSENYPVQSKTHVSLIAKGKLEASRADGGGSSVLRDLAQRLYDKPFEFHEIERLKYAYDQFGNTIFSPSQLNTAENLLKKEVYKRRPNLSDLMYLETHEIASTWAVTLNEDTYVPKHLGKILNLTASTMLLKIGYYEPIGCMTLDNNPFKIMNFNNRTVKFVLKDQYLNSKADVSIESGGKTRLTTVCSVAFSHLSQMPSNLMRAHLSNDPFCKVGFEEADKLWEVLKTYDRLKAKKAGGLSI